MSWFVVPRTSCGLTVWVGCGSIRQVRYQDRGTLVYPFALANDGRRKTLSARAGSFVTEVLLRR